MDNLTQCGIFQVASIHLARQICVRPFEWVSNHFIFHMIVICSFPVRPRVQCTVTVRFSAREVQRRLALIDDARTQAALQSSPRQVVGPKTVDHATNLEAGKNIFREGRMRPGTGGMWGPGIYFADSIQAARHKSRHGNEVVVMVTADFGTALVADCALSNTTPISLTNTGCQSVMGRGNPSSDWEYVLFDSSRITLVKMIDQFP
jgi:hypothetical protein